MLEQFIYDIYKWFYEKKSNCFPVFFSFLDTLSKQKCFLEAQNAPPDYPDIFEPMKGRVNILS